ncbi:MAG: bifunctional oligoribonuclease/PAP phosphatase NrnA [Candidatus Omnitrophota bacterium]
MNKYKKVLREIRKYKNFLLISHTNPEGDSIGSQLAFEQLLKSMGRKAFIVNSDGPGAKYAFLPGSDKIRTAVGKNIKYDAVCFLDCADIKRIGNIYKTINLTKPKINIDHHLSNTKFADIDLVEPNASSTAEVVYTLFKQAKVNIDKNCAINLYAGILTDTGSFSYSNVTPFTHEVLSDLLKRGIDTNAIFRNVYEQVSLPTIKLLSAALSTLKLSASGEVCWMTIRKEMFKKYNATLQDEENFVNFPRSLKGVEVAVFFTEVSINRVKVSLRSNNNADVNKIASCFGGGGHQKASGCTLKGTIASARQRVLSEVERQLKTCKKPKTRI